MRTKKAKGKAKDNFGIKSFLDNFFRITISVALGLILPLSSKEISRNEYITYMPIKYPKIISQTDANVFFALYGDKNDAAYHDVNPVDGIDDQRFEVLNNLALRFAPYLVQNTSDAPMDFRYFLKEAKHFPVYVDTWDIAPEKPRLVLSCSINHASDDSQLLSLIKEFHPDHPTNNHFWTIKKNPSKEFFKVLYFDFPGHDEKSWREKYNRLISKTQNNSTQSFIKTFVHLFISDERAKYMNTSGYEFVIQYWFFYPYNDGGNNHEGDWEHINVVVSPLDKVEDFLSANDVKRVLQGKGLSDKDRNESLIIKRLEYYFHYKVMVLDFSHPNVYLPKNEWRQKVKSLEKNRRGKSWIWRKTRSLAYRDTWETRINTHPFGYIGGDCRGYEQILSPPGKTNRDSHGNYPFPGIYREVGPANSSEAISTRIDHLTYYKNSSSKKMKHGDSYRRGNIIQFDDPSKIEIIPDWERVIDLVESNLDIRKNWFWLVLPLRWGYPVSSSPLAGVVSHMDVGNLSTLGPAYNEAWNRINGGSGYGVYDPHKFSSIFPLDWQSNFSNELGLLNIIIPTLQNIPPFNIISRLLKVPFDGLDKGKSIFSPKEKIPFRFVGISIGMFTQNIPENLATLSFSPEQINEINAQITKIDPYYQNNITKREYISEKMKGAMLQLNFHIGRRLISENTLRYSLASVGEDLYLNNHAEPLRIRSELNLWEYRGSLRYNFKTGNIQPYIKAGYGLNWYRVENVSTDGQLLKQSDSPWVRRPSLKKLKNLLPNSWHFGLGTEVLLIKTLNGIDVGLKLEYLKIFSSIGLEMELSPWGSATKGDIRVSRDNFSLSLTINY